MISHYVICHVTTVTCLFIIKENKRKKKIKRKEIFNQEKSRKIGKIKIKILVFKHTMTTFYLIKRLYTDNKEEYIISELQFFLKKQKVIHKTSTPHVYQQNGYAKQLNCILLEKTQSM